MPGHGVKERTQESLHGQCRLIPLYGCGQLVTSGHRRRFALQSKHGGLLCCSHAFTESVGVQSLMKLGFNQRQEMDVPDEKRPSIT